MRKALYLGTTEYKKTCIDNCFKNVLLKEVEILTNSFENELIVFAFSLRVYDLVQQYFTVEEQLRGKCSVCLMPHPASRLANDYRKYVIFGKVFKALHSKGVDCTSALTEFLDNDRLESIPSFRFRDTDREELRDLFAAKGITVNDIKIGGDNTGTIKITDTELKCKVRLPDGTFEFGAVLDVDIRFWIWDCGAKAFIDSAYTASARLGELYDMFRNYIEGFKAGAGKDEQSGVTPVL